MEDKIRILLVDNDVNLRSIVAEYLRNQHFYVDTAANGQEGLDLLAKNKHDIVIADTNLPEVSGWDMLSTIRLSGNRVPVVLTAPSDDRSDVLKAYSLECDDYIVKPYAMDILIAKVQAILRRCNIMMEQENTEFQLGSLLFDGVRQRLGNERLSSRENDLLLMLCRNMNQLVERSMILTRLWGKDTYFNSRSLSVYINRVRKMLPEDSGVQIMNVHGKGYKIVQL